ncbi:uncharacterized protein [Anabrus simplex]|uniref:uncharacterized protein n=1 Tax=Anabrus simplex TaxID=316456 RepID=UPI0034DD44C6
MSMQLQGSVLRGGRQSLLCVRSSSLCIMLYSTIKGKTQGAGICSSIKTSGGTNSKLVHASAVRSYPLAKPLPLPHNIEDINTTEKARFSPQRNRDISGPVILSKFEGTFSNGFAKRYNQLSQPIDPHVASYDCSGPVSLHSAMQTNVPSPFSSTGKAIHLNMPGGQWSQGYKYISEDMQSTHYSKITAQNKEEINKGKPGTMTVTPSFGNQRRFHTSCSLCHGKNSSVLSPFLSNSSWTSVFPWAKSIQHQAHLFYSTPVDNGTVLNRKEKLKRAVKEYGSTVIVFHIGISLISLGGFYLAVSSGLDVRSLLQYFSGGDGSSELAAGASTFVMAYAIHKVFAPVRISITLASTPFIVRHLRKVGFLKAPRPTSSSL